MFKRSGLLATVLMLCVFFALTVHSTFALITTRTASLWNTFIPDESQLQAFVPIRIQKELFSVTGDWHGLDGFLFELKDENGQIIGQALSGDDGRAEIVLGFEHEDIGTHTFTLREVDTDLNNILYDETQYTIKVDVVMEGHALRAYGTLENEDILDTVITFQNIFDNTPPPLTGDKDEPILYAALMLLSSALMITLIVRRRRSA